MSIPPRLAGKLIDVLGSDAAEDLVNWMDEMRADHAEVRHELHAARGEIAALSKSMNEKFDEMSRRFDKQDEKFDEMSRRLDKQDDKFDKQNDKFDKLVESTHAVSQRLEQLRGSLIAWNAAFWLTAVTAIVRLLQYLRR